MKTCTKCGESKPLEAYYVCKRNKSGLKERCSNCLKLENAAWYKANKDRVRDNNAAWYKANKQDKDLKNAAWKKANRIRHAATAAEYYEANRSRYLEYRTAWHKANPDRSLASTHRYRARKAANGVNLVTGAETAAISAMPCTACGAAGPSDVDHIIPIARGGSHTIGNLMPLCKPCNGSKNDMLYIEWKYSQRPQALKAFASP